MKKYFLLLLSVAIATVASAQKVEVPDNVYFAEQHLKIQESARKEIQKMVDALHRHPAYFQKKVDLADMYFPIIERVFQEEGIPEDFKYLSIQESGLQSDAISTSNAVGYWQFKREAASDFRLRMDSHVDERKHIIESTRGAANYFKRSNRMYDNWTNTLLSYYLGPTGAKSYTKASDVGSKKMVITDKTHQYILTFLAHKIAYENFVGKSAKPPVTLQEVKARPGQSLGEIALNTKTDPAEVERYNKWLSGSTIPNDKTYIVLLPVNNQTDHTVVASAEPAAKPAALPVDTNIPKAEFTTRNNLKAVIARKGDTKDKLALAAGISTRKLLKFNDLHGFEKIIEGEAYYIEKKHNQAHVEFHSVEKGETLHSISQKYGVKESSIRFKNRLAKKEVLVENRLLWMQSRRPASVAIEYRKVNNGEIARSEAPPKKGFFKRVGEFLGISPRNTDVAEVELDSVLEAENTEDETDDILTAENIEDESDDLLEAENTENETDENITDINEPVNTAVSENKTAAPARAASQPATETPAPETRTAAVTDVTEANQASAENTVKPVKEPQPKTASLPENGADKPDNKKAEAKLKPAAATESKTEPVLAETKKENTAIAAKPATNTKPVATEKATQAEQVTEPVSLAKKTESKLAVENTTVPASGNPETLPKAKAPATETKQAEKPAATKKHRVVKGETLYSISRAYNISVAELKEWNKLSDPTLSLGQLLFVSKPVAAVQPVNKTTEIPASHTVITGETLFGISKKYNLSANDLQTWNNLTDGAINIGQELRLSAPSSLAAVTTEPVSKPTGETVYHTVAEGESMYQISRKYNVTIKDIMDWNKKPDFNVSRGEQLMIKPKTSIN